MTNGHQLIHLLNVSFCPLKDNVAIMIHAFLIVRSRVMFSGLLVQQELLMARLCFGALSVVHSALHPSNLVSTVVRYDGGTGAERRMGWCSGARKGRRRWAPFTSPGAIIAFCITFFIKLN